MRATRLIAATMLAFLWLGVSLSPWSATSLGLGALATLLVVVGAALYEKRHESGSAESRKVALADALRERSRGLSPAQQRAVQSVSADCQEALARLTGAMPGRSGSRGLDALPWVVVLGVPESGRSTMLASSGLPFGFVTPAPTAQIAHSVRWWLSDRAAFIDTSGAHTSGVAGHAEWLTLLRELDALRPEQPVHGALITISADTLANSRPEDLDVWARRLRERLDELSGLLGVDVPVHVMVTRCDLIPGFAEFFADVREAERTQVWGFTLPLGGATRPAIDRIGDEMQLLLKSLSQRSLRRANVRDPLPSRLSAFQFPLWFAATRANLMAVASTLFAENRFQQTLLARGVWFTSSAEARGYSSNGAQGGRGFFIRDVLANHVAPDGALARTSAAELRRRLHQRLLFATPLICASLLACVLSLTAYSANRELLSGYTDAMNAAAAAPAPAPIERMEAFRARTAELRERVEQGPPRWMRMGLFVGEEVAPRASTAYALYVLRDVARPALSESQRALGVFLSWRDGGIRASETARAEATDNLRLYLLLTTPRAAVEPDPRVPEEAAWLTAQLTQRWAARRRAGAEDTARMREIVRLYTAILASDQRLGTPRDLVFVDRVRRALLP